MDNIMEITQQEDRILYLSKDIDSDSISDICKKILDINHTDRVGLDKYRNYAMRPIELHVQSFGGSIYDMWSLIDVIESSNTPIITFCNGYCMSAAALIFLAGHYRIMYKHSAIMFHQLSSVTFGKMNDLIIEQTQTENLHKDMIKYIRKKTNLKKKFYKKYDKNKENIYMDSKKCLKFGVCDEVAEKSDWRNTLLEQMKQSPEECCDVC
ncbi:MAG: ATP-dependent Clp protease proteolytic subunit [Methanobrevibacter sp.]|nr:ATP-dependent Clp protease proteolytic subunit [Methanobrevibacter sp.]MBO7692769.1 ATP-dependent Clp protease proteolytic subunit [Methanobrevibacter sp.]